MDSNDRLSHVAFRVGGAVHGKTLSTSAPRPLGVDGQKLSLVKSSKVKQSLGFNVAETTISAVLSQRYAKYLVGKYRILPQKLPAAWAEYLTKLVQEYRDDDFERVGR